MSEIIAQPLDGVVELKILGNMGEWAMIDISPDEARALAAALVEAAEECEKKEEGT